MLLSMVIQIAFKLFFLLPIPPLSPIPGEASPSLSDVLIHTCTLNAYGCLDFTEYLSKKAKLCPFCLLCFGVNGRGFARFVNIRDKSGETPLHLAARQGQPECAHVLLDSGALACASTGGQG